MGLLFIIVAFVRWNMMRENGTSWLRLISEWYDRTLEAPNGLHGRDVYP
jgi:hypothetical protein